MLRFEVVDFLIIEIAAIVLRTWMWATEAGVWYFPDSNIYIYAHQFPVYASSRPGAISTLWYDVTFGVFDARALVVAQFIAGLIAVAMIYDLLRRLVHRYAALAGGLIFALFPMIAIYERTVMAEAFALDFLVAGFWTLAVSFMARSWWIRLPAIILALGSFGVAAVLRSALVIPTIAVIVVGSVVWLVREQGRRLQPLVVGRSLAALVLGGLLFAAPLEAQMNTAQTAVGLHTLNPLTGSFLAARWTKILPCTSEKATLRLVKRSLKQLCRDKRFTERVPGYSMNLVWYAKTPIGKTVFVNHHFAQTQQELQAIAMKAIEQHPGFVASSMAAVVVNELFSTPYLDAVDYNNGYKLFAYSSYRHHPAVLKEFMQVNVKPAKGTNRLLQSMAISTARWPQYLFWVVLAGLLVRSAWWLQGVLRRTRHTVTRDPEQSAYLWGRWAMVSAAWIFLFSHVLGIAFSAFAVFRYNLMLLPSLMILLTCVWTRPVVLNAGEHHGDDRSDSHNSVHRVANSS